MVSQQFQPLFIFIVFLFQQPKWIWIYFYVSSTFPHICFHHCCFVVFKNNIGTLLKVHWELHTHWVVATSDPVFLAIFAQATIVLWNETRGASDTMQICEVRPGWVRLVTGNCVLCGATLPSQTLRISVLYLTWIKIFPPIFKTQNSYLMWIHDFSKRNIIIPFLF